MQSYQSARNLFSFLGFCAGALIVLGAIVAFFGGSAAQSTVRNAGIVHVILGAMPGIMMVAVGVFGQAMVQMGRASVDTAEYAQQSLDVSRKHMELSQQLLEQGRTTAASFASLNIQRPAPAADPQSASQDHGASYASQPTPAVGITNKEAEPAAIEKATATATKAITHEQQVPLPPLSWEITYKGGKFAIGDRLFATKLEALDFKRSHAPVAAK